MVLAASLLVAGWLAGGMTLVLTLAACGGITSRREVQVLFGACVVVWVLIAVLGVSLFWT